MRLSKRRQFLSASAAAMCGVLALGLSSADEYPLALRTVHLPEFQAARGWMEGLRIGPGESHQLRFEIGASSFVSVATTSDGNLSLALKDPAGNDAATESISAGATLAVALHLTATTGVWSAEFNNAGGSTVTVSCEVVVNATIEAGSNTTMPNAQALDAEFRSAAAGTARKAAAIGEVAGAVGSADWYRVSLDSAARLTAVVRRLGNQVPTVELLDAAGSTIAGSVSSDLPAGDYFFKVSGDGARYALGVVIGGWVWPALWVDLEGSVLGYAPPEPAAVQTSAFVADFGSNSANEVAVADMIKTWSPEFIFTGGDNIYASGNVGIGAAGWKTRVGDHYGEFIQARSDGAHPELTSPTQRFYPSVGNQDGTIVQPGGGSIAGYVDYFHDNPGGSPRLPTDAGAVHNAGESYYRIRKDVVELFVLDTDHARQNAASMDRQRDWLRAAVASSDAPWRFVIAHHPPYASTKPGGGFSELRWLETIDAEVIFSGDAHVYERLDLGGDLLALICGIGGQSRANFSKAIAQSRFHFDDEYGALRIDARPAGVDISLRTIDDGADGNNGGRQIELVNLGERLDPVLSGPGEAIVIIRPLVAATLTPPLPNGAASGLDLKLRLLRDGLDQAPAEAEDDNSAPDGRNARMLFPIDSDGVGYLEVTRQSDAGGPFEIVFLDPYDAWLLDLEIPPGTDTSPGADPDCDGLSNWFEYAVASKPFKVSTPVSVAIDPNNPTNYHITYLQRSDHVERGISYSIEISHDLATWVAAPGAGQIGSPTAGVTQWRLTLPAGDGRTFVRMGASGS